MSDLLVVSSKIKKYIKDKSQMSTSASTLNVLSDIIKSVCDQAIVRAQADGRKTVMDRDVPSSTPSSGGSM
jgi:histone H3/H4